MLRRKSALIILDISPKADICIYVQSALDPPRMRRILARVLRGPRRSLPRVNMRAFAARLVAELVRSSGSLKEAVELQEVDYARSGGDCEYHYDFYLEMHTDSPCLRITRFDSDLVWNTEYEGKLYPMIGKLRHRAFDPPDPRKIVPRSRKTGKPRTGELIDKTEARKAELTKHGKVSRS